MRLAVLLALLALFSANVFPQESRRGLTIDTWRKRAKFYEPLIASIARRYNVDPHLLWTIAYLESRFRNDVVSFKDGKPCAYGMMQFTVSTAREYRLINPHDPRESLDAAARYMRDLQSRFGPRVDLILAAYNAGEGTVEAFRDGKPLVLPNNKVINPRGLRTGGLPPYKETRQYVALGGIIYGKITRAAIFQETISVDKSLRVNARDSTRVNTGRQDSFYVSRTSRKPTGEQTVKPAPSDSNKSIYVN
jgi:soluble lytic murein transglycosylase-like protein